MAKFKVGDRVRIIKSLYNFFYMTNKIGQIKTIEKVFEGQEDGYYLEGLGTYVWRNEELELVERSLTPELQSFKDEYVSNNFAIKVETQQAYDEVIDKLDKLGYTWRSGDALKKDRFRLSRSMLLHTQTNNWINNEKAVYISYIHPEPYANTVYKTYKPFERITDDIRYGDLPLRVGEETYTLTDFLRIQGNLLKTHERIMKQGKYRMEKNNMNNIHFIDTIAFNKKTFKTTMVLKYGSDEYDAVEVVSNKKDFVDFRIGFLLAYLKFELYDVEYKGLIHELFRQGKPRITFLQGYASHLFDNFRQMNKVLDAIKSEKDQVNIGGRIIKLIWKE